VEDPAQFFIPYSPSVRPTPESRQEHLAILSSTQSLQTLSSLGAASLEACAAYPLTHRITPFLLHPLDMLILPTLSYTLLGAAISWASPAPIAGGDVSNVQSTNPTELRREAPAGTNCHASADCDDNQWPHESASQFLAGLIQQLPDDYWYQNGFQIGASLLHKAIGVSDCPFPS
jgi:hypothetical protein